MGRVAGGGDAGAARALLAMSGPTAPEGGRRGRAWLVAAAPILAAVLLFALWRALIADPVTDATEHGLTDLRFRLRGAWETPPAAVVVAVDEAALAVHETPAALRAALARAVPAIAAARPTALGLDLLLVARTPADAALAGALAKAPGVRLAVAALPRREGAADGAAAPGAAPTPDRSAALARSAVPRVTAPPDAPPAASTGPLLMPAPPLARAARLAHVNLRLDRAGVPRALPVTLPGPEGRPLPAMPLALAAEALGAPLALIRGEAVRFGPRRLALDAAGDLTLDHPGPAGTVRAVPLGAVLSGAAPPEAFAGRIVLVGATAGSLADTFVSPWGGEVAGVEVLVGAAAALAEGRVLRRDAATAAISAGLALALAAALLGAAAAPGNAAALAAGTVSAAAAAALVQAAFARHGLVLDATTAAFAALLAGGAGAERRYRLSRREARRSARREANLVRFVAPALAERMAEAGPDGFGRREQPATLLFVDLVGFTSQAETAQPGETAEFLSRLHALYERESAHRGGVIVDWQGDGALIVFGLPQPAADDAARALATAVALADAAPALAGGPLPKVAPRLRVSVHHGPVAAAVLGGRSQSVVTVAGDAVNLASRLQDVAKAEGVDLVATREALEAAGPEAARGWRPLTRASLRGRVAQAEVWRGPARAGTTPTAPSTHGPDRI